MEPRVDDVAIIGNKTEVRWSTDGGTVCQVERGTRSGFPSRIPFDLVCDSTKYNILHEIAR